MPLPAVLFDLDGTLIDHEAAAAEALDRSLPGLDAPARARARRAWRELETAAMARYFAGELTFAEQRRVRAAGLAAELGFGAWDDAAADRWFAGYLGRYEAAWRPYGDVRPALEALTRAGHRLGVITNGDADQQRHKLRRTGLAAILTEVVASSEVGAAKPDARIFHHAAQRLGLAPDRVVYVGDRLETDAVAATRAGMRGVWLNRGGRVENTGVPAIGSLAELPALLGDQKSN
ncbi:HAD family hydrolase [Dactylosporangium sp. CS-033363]|uniref:HAD family hydrolase n=1 Tax=Dactylosporangium sp. CS-033363 TaxID=3239935 RepID=UPI003D8DE60E